MALEDELGNILIVGPILGDGGDGEIDILMEPKYIGGGPPGEEEELVEGGPPEEEHKGGDDVKPIPSDPPQIWYAIYWADQDCKKGIALIQPRLRGKWRFIGYVM